MRAAACLHGGIRGGSPQAPRRHTTVAAHPHGGMLDASPQAPLRHTTVAALRPPTVAPLLHTIVHITVRILEA